MKIKYFDQNKKTKFLKWYNNDKYAKYVWKYRFMLMVQYIINLHC